MLIDYDTYQTFSKPRQVGDSFEGEGCERHRRIVWESVKRRHEAYQILREVKAGVYDVTEVEERDGGVFFNLTPSARHNEIVSAVLYDCVWSTNKNDVDYAATIERWCLKLEHDEVNAEIVERIQQNDLDRPEFGDFKITMMEYLISCTRRGNKFFRIDGFEAVRPSD